MNEQIKEVLWVEKYRPQILDDCILPKSSKNTFEGFLAKKELPNLILAGKAGVGKTTVAKIIAHNLGYETLVINASLENGIDTLRNKIQSFASSISLTANKKIVILDEADGLNPNSIQPALRAFIEQFSAHVQFIFTCNYLNRLIEPLQSRCTIIPFDPPSNEKKELLAQTIKRLIGILKQENVIFDVKTVAQLVSRHFPDIRRCINELQRYSANGSIDNGILVATNHNNFEQLVTLIRDKKFTEMRKWFAVNKDISSDQVFRYFFDNAESFMKKESIPQLILTTAEYQYKQAFVSDLEINISAWGTEIMSMCEFL